MIKKDTVKVVFVYTKEEAQWVSRYLIDHPQDSGQIKVVGGTISSQLELLQRHGRTFDQEQLFKNTDTFTDHVTALQHQSVDIYNLLIRKIAPFLVFEINLIKVLKILIQSELIDVIFAYDLYRRIEHVWQPDVYYFPHDLSAGTSGWQATHFSAAAFIKDFLGSSKKVRTFIAEKSHPVRRPINTPLPKIDLKKLQIAAELLIFRLREFYQKPQSTPADILLFSGGYNLYYYYKLYRLLSKERNIKIATLTGFQTIEHELLLRKSGIPFVPLEKFADAKIELNTNIYQKKFQEYLKEEITEERIVNVLLPRHLPYSFSYAIYFKLHMTLTKYSKRLIRQTLLARKAIATYFPKLMVTTHDPGPSALPFVFKAQADKIPTLVLLHGYHGMSYGADHESDYIASWGKLLKQGFITKLKKKPQSILSIGFPFFDEYFIKKKPQVKTWVKSRHRPIRLGLLLTLYQVDQLAAPHFLFEIFAEVSKTEMLIKLEIRTHAGQKFEGIEDLARHYNVAYEFNEPIVLDQFIKQNDVILSWDTTAILWALLYRKPLMYTTPWWCQGLIPATRYKAAWLVTSAMGVVEKLKQLQDRPQMVEELYQGQQKLLQDVLGVTDGSSSEKLLDLLKKLAKRSERN